MKTRITLFFSALLALTVSHSWGQEANPIQINVRVYQLDRELADGFDKFINETLKGRPNPSERVAQAIGHWEEQGRAELIAHPIITTPAGSSTSFDVVREITYPGSYDPATVPKELPGKLIVGVGDVKKEPLKTNESNAVIPPFPKNFVMRELGLQLKVTPKLGTNGKVLVDFEVKQSALKGFLDHGSPIEMERPGAKRKNAEPIELHSNQLLLPTFLTHSKKFQVSPAAEGFFLLHEKEVPRSADHVALEYSKLGEEHSESRLAPLLFVVSGQPVETGLKTLPHHDSGKTATKTKSWPFHVNVRKTLGLSSDQPNEDAGLKLKSRLAEIGIRTRELTIDPDWNLEVTATPEMIARLGELISVYEAGPQVFVSAKFLELPESIDLEKSILTETEFQTFIREFSQEKGVDLLSAPSIVMRPYQDGLIEVAREFLYPVTYDPPALGGGKNEDEISVSFPVSPSIPKEFESRNTGVQLGLRTRLFEDRSIEVGFRPEVSEFLGYLNFGQPITVLHQGALGKYHQVVLSENVIQMPVFHNRSLDSRVRIPDGSTLLVGGLVKTDIQFIEDKVPLLGDIPIIGRAARSRKEVKMRRFVYLALTVKAIKPNGLALAK